jgi:hypothetical protein
MAPIIYCMPGNNAAYSESCWEEAKEVARSPARESLCEGGQALVNSNSKQLSRCIASSLYFAAYSAHPREGCPSAQLFAQNPPRQMVYCASQFCRKTLYRFSSNVTFLELDYPLSGAIDIGILHSLYNQAPKKVI